MIKQGSQAPFAEVCLDAAASLRAAGYAPRASFILGAYPFITGNPFQRMLYSRSLEHGVACLPLHHPALLDEAPSGPGLIAHYHWLHRAFYGLSSARDAAEEARKLVDLVKRQQDRGVNAVWTVHNKLSHNAAFPEEELWLRREFAACADLIHIMNPASADICADLYELPEEKTVHIPHPSYSGVYAAYESRHASRLSLGLEPEAVTFLIFGALGPHKGTRQFLEAIDDLQKGLEGKAHVVVAGKPGPADFMEDMYRLTAGRTDISLHLGRVDDADVQTFFTAADIVVCPYPQGLNSGVMNTALGFSRPVVSSQALAQSITGLDAGLYAFEAGNTADCIRACIQAAADASSLPGEVFSTWAQIHKSHDISDKFFQMVRARL